MRTSEYNGPSETCPQGKQRISIDMAQERNACMQLGPAPAGSQPRMCRAATITFLKLFLVQAGGRGVLARARSRRGCSGQAGRKPLILLLVPQPARWAVGRVCPSSRCQVRPRNQKPFCAQPGHSTVSHSAVGPSELLEFSLDLGSWGNGMESVGGPV